MQLEVSAGRKCKGGEKTRSWSSLEMSKDPSWVKTKSRIKLGKKNKEQKLSHASNGWMYIRARVPTEKKKR